MEQIIAMLELDADPQSYVIFAATFLGILLFVTGVMQLFMRGETYTETHNRRLRMIAEGKNTPELLELLKPVEQPNAFFGLPFLRTLPRDLNQAGLLIKPRRFVLFCLLATAGITLVMLGMFMPIIAVPIGIVAGFFLPIIMVQSRRKQRLDRLVAQLPDALDLMSRGLAVGHPLNTTIGSVAKEMPDPIGTEFGIIFDQVSFGDNLTDAVQDFADRIDLEDTHYLAASIGIQHGTGGDLARVTNLLGETIRNRIAMRRRIRAISSEGRLTAQFLSVLPFGVFLFSMITTPSHFGGVMGEPLFPAFAATVIVLTVVNALILRRLVNFRI